MGYRVNPSARIPVLVESRFGGSVQRFEFKSPAEVVTKIVERKLTLVRDERAVPMAHKNRSRTIRFQHSRLVATA